MKTSESTKNIIPALLAAKKEFGSVVADQKGQDGNRLFKYADIGGYIDATKPALDKNGLTVMQDVGIDGGIVYVKMVLFHSSGEFIESAALPVPARGIIEKPKDFGGVITYARRYQYAAFFCLAQEDEAGESAKPFSPQQVKPPAQSQPRQTLPVGPKQSVAIPQPVQAPAYDGEPPFAVDEEEEIGMGGIQGIPAQNQYAGYVIKFGKHNGKTLGSMNPKELSDYAIYLESSAHKKGEALSPNAAELVNAIKQFLN